ncbi:MAG: hypothetical protein J7J11_00255 [Desulfurococcales archaeon]|nr:hypothetical protein [Desulfurococcales archaeon]
MGRVSSREVSVRTGYRIYVGFYRFKDLPYLYGALGFSLEEPQLVLIASNSHDVSIRSPLQEINDLVRNALKVLKASGVSVSLSGYLGLHSGLGLRTRVVLSTVTAVSLLKKVDADPVRIAQAMGRGRLSAVGLHTFMHGNLVIDSGARLRGGRIAEKPELIAVFPVPEEWYVVVAVPEEGLEKHAFDLESCLANVEEYVHQAELYREVTMLISSLTHGDFKTFTNSIARIQEHNRRYFTEHSGTFYGENTSELIEYMRRAGLKGVGQSLLGPTAFGFTDSYIKAVEARTAVLEYFSRRGLQGRAWVTNVARIGHHVTISRRYVRSTAKAPEIT